MSSRFPWKRRCIYHVGSLIRSNKECLGRYITILDEWLDQVVVFSSFLRRRRPVSDGNSPTKVLCTLYMHTSTIKHRYNQCNHIKLNNCRRIFDNKTHQASYEVPRCSQWGQTLFEIVFNSNFYPVTILRDISYFFHSVEEI